MSFSIENDVNDLERFWELKVDIPECPREEKTRCMSDTSKMNGDFHFWRPIEAENSIETNDEQPDICRSKSVLDNWRPSETNNSFQPEIEHSFQQTLWNDATHNSKESAKIQFLRRALELEKHRKKRYTS